jgi:hypothetical protein
MISMQIKSVLIKNSLALVPPSGGGRGFKLPEIQKHTDRPHHQL